MKDLRTRISSLSKHHAVLTDRAASLALKKEALLEKAGQLGFSTKEQLSKYVQETSPQLTARFNQLSDQVSLALEKINSAINS